MTMIGPFGPQSIFVIRHGEEPSEGDSNSPPFGVTIHGEQNRHSLTPAGWQRAGALAVLFGNGVTGPTSQIVTPDRIIAVRYDDDSSTKHHRSYQTVLPLARRLGLSIETPYSKGQEPRLASSILATAGLATLICWERHHIPDIIANLLVDGDGIVPAIWPQDRYDIIWCLTRTPTTARSEGFHYIFEAADQRLLSQDAGIA
jgi:hypothetical protein